MIPPARRQEFRCPAGVYAEYEGRIADLTAAINQAPTARDKVGPAQELAGEMEALLACPEFDTAGSDCRLCRGLAELRSKTAALVAKAGALAERRGQ